MALPLRFGYNRQRKSARFVLAFFFEKTKKPKTPSVPKLKTIADKGRQNGLFRDRQYKNKGFYLVTMFFGFWMHKPWLFWLFGFCADKAISVVGGSVSKQQRKVEFDGECYEDK